MVTITVENGGVIKLELYPEIAPSPLRTLKSWLRTDFTTALSSTVLSADL